MIKSFIQLTEREKLQCYEFAKERRKNNKQSFEEFVEYCGGEAFNGGDNYFTALIDGAVEGTVAVVTKEVPVRGEAFIFNFNWKEAEGESTAQLLKKAVEVCTLAKSPSAKLSISPGSSEELPSAIMKQGFQEGYEAYNMKLPGCKCSSQGNMAQLDFVVLENDNMDEYVRIHNNAFRRAPNGGDISLEELKKDIEECADKPELIGLARYNGTYAGIYCLEMKDGTGWINAIGIHEDYLKKSFGEELVRKCMDILNSFEVREIKLTVISSNERAYNLYKKLGFVIDEVISTWFVKELK